MAVRRIIANLPSADPAGLGTFYADIFGLTVVMDMGWIVTLAGTGAPAPQLSLAAEGGGGQPVPGLTIEVDDLDATPRRAAALGVHPEHGPVEESWGVRRAFLRHPARHLLNVMVHRPA